MRTRENFGPSQRSMSSIRVNAAGTITSVNAVEVMRPPITATAIGARNEASPWIPIATGNMPATIATVVITIGRARLWPASRSAVIRSLPARISSIAKSTSRIEFLATMPISIRKPMTTGSDNGKPTSNSATAAPPMDKGRAERIVMGWNTRAKSNTSTANTISTPVNIAIAKLANNSRMYPDAPFVAAARAEVARSLTADNIAREVLYLEGDGREAFERPYGLAWLLRLAAELREWDDPQSRAWMEALAPLETAAAAQLKSWLPQLIYPIRSGEHSQTALSFGLMWDWALVSGDTTMRELLAGKAEEFYAKDRKCPLAFEPSGTDFLSPCLAEADFMRRVLDRKAFSRWLGNFFPNLASSDPVEWLRPAVVTDRNDPKLAHIDGLNLSRAWMLDGIASALSKNDLRVNVLLITAALHRQAGLPAVVQASYVGSHWLGTYAVYLTSRAGINAGRPEVSAAANSGT